MSYDPHPPTGGGGSVTDATISTSDITTNNASATKHGWLIKLANTATKFLRDDGTWQTIGGGGDALVANPLSQFANTTSLQLKGVITDETGSGALVFATTPTLATPILGVATATSINKVAVTAPATGSTLTIQDGFTLTATGNASISGTHTGTSSGTNTGDVANTALTTGTLAQFASTTSAQLATLLSDETGSGAAVFATSPSLVTPTLGVASVTTVNKVTVTAPATGSTLTIVDGATLTASATASVAGTHTGTSSGTNTGDQTNITGNAATVTTNANLTGPVTSVGNATTIADVELAALAGLTSAADKLPYFTGSGTASLADFTTAARALLDDANAAAMLTTLGALALAGGTMSGAIALGNNNITGGKQFCFNGEVAGGNKTGATQNLADWTAGSACTITLTGNCTGTSTMTSPTGVSRLTLRIVQGGAGSFTISTWPATVKWAGGVAPTLSTAVGAVDIVTFYWNSTSYYGVASLAFA